MKTSEFDYELPPELIAQTPLACRSQSRLMVLHRTDGSLEHRHFSDLPDYLRPGDVLVRNNTRVIPARLFGIKEETGAHVELLLLKQDGDQWECLVGNARVVKLGTVITFHNGELKAECIGIGDKGIRFFRMIYEGIFIEILEKLGTVPLPPYIKEKLNDPQRYQTVYAKVDGSAAAPTAGLHFTPELFETLRTRGVQIEEITLHVGLGTFRPMDTEDVQEHHMHSEWFMMDRQTAQRLNEARAQGRRIIAVGTTSCRTLEAIMSRYGQFQECHEETDIFIYPGYQFKAIDALITNFHLPESTLIMLVSAFAGRQAVLNAYRTAVQQRYRFFSFGDAMFIE